MSAQPHLNGAYYGPSIPPPHQPRRKSYRPGRNSSSSCNPFTRCFCCLFNCALSIILQIIVGILVISSPPSPSSFSGLSSAQTSTNFTSPTLPSPNSLSPNPTIPPSTTISPSTSLSETLISESNHYYDKIDATAYYHGQRFAATEIPKFYLGHKKENYVNPQFVGQQLIVLSNGDLKRYNSEKGFGVYEIDVKLKIRMRFKVVWVKTGKFTPEIECELKIPLNSNGSSSSSGSFERKKCGFDW